MARMAPIAPELAMMLPRFIQRAHARRWRHGLAVVGSLLLAGRAAGGERAEPAALTERRPAPIRIELGAEVEVKQPRVKLGDVAKLAAADPATLQRLADLSLGQAPAAGHAFRLERERLSRWIRAQTGIGAELIEWAGPAVSDVRLSARLLSGDAIAECAIESVRARRSGTEMRIEPSVNQRPPDQAIPLGRLELRARPLPEADLLAKRLSLPVEIMVDGRLVRAVPVSLDLKAFGPAVVATQRQSAGEPLQTSAFEVREVEWSGRDLLPVQRARREALRLRRPVEPGTLLTRAHVEPAPVVAQGDWATLHVRQGLLDLERRVEVLQDGRAGERVRVKLKTAGPAILARVTGPGTVEVVQ